MLYGGFISTAMVGVTIYLLSDLPLDNTTKYCVGLSIFLSNICIFATTNQFITSILFIMKHYEIINNILHQLMFGSPEMLKSNELIGDDEMRIREFRYTKYRNNFHTENILLRDQMEISTIKKSENFERKKDDLRRQKENLEKCGKRTFFVPNRKTLVFQNVSQRF